MEVIWNDIEGFEGKYQISNQGEVKSLNYNNTGKEKILKPKINRHNNLLEVTLNKGNKHYYRTISRLVIESFTEKKLSKNDIIMYKDSNKNNCALNNLYIISRGKRQEITYNHDRRYRPKYEYYNKVLSIKEISKLTGIDPKTIRTRMTRLYWNIYEASEIPIGKPHLNNKIKEVLK